MKTDQHNTTLHYAIGSLIKYGQTAVYLAVIAGHRIVVETLVYSSRHILYCCYCNEGMAESCFSTCHEKTFNSASGQKERNASI